jgi:hypothetical protein
MEGNDTLESQKYEWENGRLVRMTANGVVRNYFYGKTLRDPVRVEPSDEGFNYHRGYNGTAGKIPEEGTPDYEIFSRDPYGHVHFGEIEKRELPSFSFASKKSSGSLNVLGKKITPETAIVTLGCVKEDDDMPEAWCARLKREAMTNFAEDVEQGTYYGYPGKKDTLDYGHSEVKLDINFECGCNESGKYQPSFTSNITYEEIVIMQSTWRYRPMSGNYSINYWYEQCWMKADLQQTYAHEAKHIRNAWHKVENIISDAREISSNTEAECKRKGNNEVIALRDKWNKWYKDEQNHKNLNSPKYSGQRGQYLCLY